MMTKLWKLLNVEPEERGQVSYLLLISFLLGLFIATFAVASQTLFLNTFDEKYDLPLAVMISGIFGIMATYVYNFLQGRLSFVILALINLIVIAALVGVIEFNEFFALDADVNLMHAFGFTLILPFIYIMNLIFWGAFQRMFNARSAKRLLGSVDVGIDISTVIGFFLIPVLLQSGIPVPFLYSISLVSIVGYIIFFLIMSNKYLRKNKLVETEASEIKKLNFAQFFGNRYILILVAFIIVSLATSQFIQFSFFNVSVSQFSEQGLPYFLSLFEGTIVIVSFVLTTALSDRLHREYGLRSSLLLTPLILLLFAVLAIALGSYFGYDVTEVKKSQVIYFSIAVAMSKLCIDALTDAVNEPYFRYFYVPLNKEIKIDVQTKLEGVIMSIGSTLAGGCIVLINQFDFFDLLSITFFTVPLILLWIWIINRMYVGYRNTLLESLNRHKAKIMTELRRVEYSVRDILTRNIKSKSGRKVLYILKIMEKLEPGLFESSIQDLSTSRGAQVRDYAMEKMAQLDLITAKDNTRRIAGEAMQQVERSDQLHITPDKLMRLSKSVAVSDRMLAAKLILHTPQLQTIFILLELLRDTNAQVRLKAILTARRLKRPETWPLLIEMLVMPEFSQQAASALQEGGTPVLPFLENAFHRYTKNEVLTSCVIQVIGNIGGDEGLDLLWKAINNTDQEIVRTVLHALRIINFRASGRHAVQIKDILDDEMYKMFWNVIALSEIPKSSTTKFLIQALNEEIQENYDQIVLLLSLLYDPDSVYLVKENIDVGTPDSIQHALELLDLFVEGDVKEKLVPLLEDTSADKKMEILRVYYPREKYSYHQTINHILNRDYYSNNRWTKACALHMIATIPDYKVSWSLVSQLFNRDKMLQETAAWSIYQKDKDLYEKISQRLPIDQKKALDISISNNQLLDGLDDGFFLQIEIGMVLKLTLGFKDIHGKYLSYLSDTITPITLEPGVKYDIEAKSSPFIICADGVVELSNNGSSVMTMERGSVFGEVFQIDSIPQITSMKAIRRGIVFKLESTHFYFLMSRYPQMANLLIKEISGTEIKTS